MSANAPFRTVTVYESFASGNRARKMFSRLASSLENEIEITEDVWKFELLAHARLREFAIADAAAADMVILSACADSPLPPHIEDWFEQWMARRSSRPAALVALLEQQEGPLTARSPFCARLRRMAVRARLDFFCKTGNWEREDFEYLISPAGRLPKNSSTVMEELLHQELRSQFCWLARSRSRVDHSTAVPFVRALYPAGLTARR